MKSNAREVILIADVIFRGELRRKGAPLADVTAAEYEDLVARECVSAKRRGPPITDNDRSDDDA